MIVWLLLRVFPRKDSRTSFAVWFATLVITAALPLLGLFAAHGNGRSAVVTVSAGWAVYIFIGWAAVACVGLLRVGVALWQVRRLRAEAVPVELGLLGPEMSAFMEEFKRSRSVKLLVSKRVEVPTAIGFVKPAIVLPEWLLQETPAEELKYILLHELAHLRRRDDWTNLVQQIVKALLFFVPSVWWIERRLALDREMACDDAVLAQAGTARGYAECLARVAERSFLRRQLALAQAAVSRLRQLTVRVAKILDPNRQQPARMWRPAIPAVVMVAGLCVFSASQAPTLIGFGDAASENSAQTVAVGSLVQNSAGAKAIKPVMLQSTRNTEPKMVPASLKTFAPEQENKLREWNAAYRMNDAAQRKSREHETYTLTNLHAESKIQPALMALARLDKPEAEYVMVREELMVVVSQHGDAPPVKWQLRVVTISVSQSKPQKQVPKKI
jgi:beta-lactamase regulating signal transducer with metallopeptidase domain